MNFFKLLLYSFLVLIAMTTLPQKPASAIPKSEGSSIAAVVNDESILKSELRNRIRLVMASGQMEQSEAIYNQLKEQILETIIDERLKIQQAEKFIKVSDEELEREFSRFEQQYGGEGKLLKFLERHKIPKDVFMQHVKTGLLWRTYINELYRPVVRITKSEIQNTAKRRENEKGKTQVLIAEIVLPFHTSHGKIQAKKQTNDLLQQIQKGAQFPMLSHQFSKSPSAAQGGDIGWIASTHLDAPIRQAVDKMNPGELSPPILNGDAYHIVLLRDKKDGGETVEKLVSFYKVFVPWAPGSSDTQKQQLYRRMQNISRSAKSLSILKNLTQAIPNVDAKAVSDVRAHSLHPQLRKILEELAPENSSEAIATPMGVFIFFVKEWREIRPDTEEKIYQDLMERKLMQLSKKVMIELRRKAFINIRA